LAAWRGLERFDGRSSLRSWLYRIATNRSLNALRDKRRRLPRVPIAEPPEPTRRSEPIWLQPYPDALLDAVADTSPRPEVRYELKEAVGLAFMAALHHLPPRQRAVLVLRDVLGFRATEVADMLVFPHPRRGTTGRSVGRLCLVNRLVSEQGEGRVEHPCLEEPEWKLTIDP
jgi:RNA polymerase sigma-70 factor, ECF subfamily